MFNGIIFNKGIIDKIINRPKGINIFIKSDMRIKKKDIGMSISCDGVCLTLIRIKKKSFLFYLSKETLKRSNFKKAKIDNVLNIEKSIKFHRKPKKIMVPQRMLTHD